MEALTKQNGVRLLGKFKKKFKKKVKTNLPYLSFYKKKPETHIFFFLAQMMDSLQLFIEQQMMDSLQLFIEQQMMDSLQGMCSFCILIHLKIQ